MLSRFLTGLAALAAGPLLSSPTWAAGSIDFSGYYTVMYISEHNLGNFSAAKGFADSYFAHRLQINMAFRPTDEISVHWMLRGPHLARWGTKNQQTMETKHVYGQIDKDWGTIKVGRLHDRADDYGLANLGYIPVSSDWGWSQIGPFDGWDWLDAVEYKHSLDNGFGLTAQYAKLVNRSQGFGAYASDFDKDRYLLEPQYKWKNGGISLGLMYERDAGPDGRDAQGRHASGALDKTKNFFLNPAFMHNIGNWGLHAEAKLGWGKSEYLGDKSLDVEGYGLYLDLDYNYGPGNIMLAGWWASGTGMEEAHQPDGKSKSLVNFGGGFYPLVIAYNYGACGWNRLASQGVDTNAPALANNAFAHYVLPNRATVLGGGTSADIPGVTGAGGPNQAVGLVQKERWNTLNDDSSNHWALMLSGNQPLTEEITFRYALAYLGLNKANYRVLNSYRLTGGGPLTYDSVDYRTQAKDLGFEVDLAVSVQLLDNLILSSTFGYMFTGDAYQTLKGYKIGPADGAGHKRVRAVWADSDDSYGWYNTLTFLF